MSDRIEHGTLSDVRVPADHYWGAQTQRSTQNFGIGGHRMPHRGDPRPRHSQEGGRAHELRRQPAEPANLPTNRRGLRRDPCRPLAR
jgi:hypothetical protein